MRDVPIAGRDRLPTLTGLRFFAAALVVVYHLSRTVGQLPVVSDLAWYGRCGVTFFFVLSGFVLAWSYDGTHTRPLVFYWRRFARVWPLAALSVVLSVATYAALDIPVRTSALVAGLTLTNAWSSDPTVYTGGNPAVWSLSDEAFFYLAFPVLLAALAAQRARTALALAASASAGAAVVWLMGSRVAAEHRVWLLDYFPPTRLLEFVVGVAVALAMRRGWRCRVPMWAAVVLVVAYLAVLVPWHQAVPDTEWYSPYSASQLLSTPVFALLISAAAQADLAGRRTGCSGARFRRLGHWSFAWYLVHEIVIRWTLHHLERPVGTVEVAVRWGVVLVGSLAAAAALYQFVEHPVERFLRRAGPQSTRSRRHGAAV